VDRLPKQLKEQTMTHPFETEYKALHAAALTLSTKMMATLPQEQLDVMASMTQHGAKLVLELEMPNCKEVALVLREIEGKRSPVCKLGTRHD
jgi:hypothetical protein